MLLSERQGAHHRLSCENALQWYAEDAQKRNRTTPSMHTIVAAGNALRRGATDVIVGGQNGRTRSQHGFHHHPRGVQEQNVTHLRQAQRGPGDAGDIMPLRLWNKKARPAREREDCPVIRLQ